MCGSPSHANGSEAPNLLLMSATGGKRTLGVGLELPFDWQPLRHPACLFKAKQPVLARPNRRTRARLVVDFRLGESASIFSRCTVPNRLSLPRRRLVRSTDQSGDFVGVQNGHERRCGNFHDCHAPTAASPAYINGLVTHELRSHADAADRYFYRYARIVPGP